MTAHSTTGARGPRQMQAGEGAWSTLLGPGGLPCLRRTRGSPLTAPAPAAVGVTRRQLSGRTLSPGLTQLEPPREVICLWVVLGEPSWQTPRALGTLTWTVTPLSLSGAGLGLGCRGSFWRVLFGQTRCGPEGASGRGLWRGWEAPRQGCRFLEDLGRRPSCRSSPRMR